VHPVKRRLDGADAKLDTSTAPLNVEVRDGGGRTNTSSRSINLQTVSAGSVTVVNNGLTAGSDIRLKDGKAPRYLATLLAAPGRELHVLELAGMSAPPVSPGAAHGLTIA
jgi:hypothetical protein